uniref:Uncharacterized protein n=1 Tax=Gallus gallus TaxID=9031 RepID=A0A8V0Z5I5_CHICK
MPTWGLANPTGLDTGTLMVSMMWVCPLSTSTALLWLMSSNLTPLAARTWSPTRMPFCSRNRLGMEPLTFCPGNPVSHHLLSSSGTLMSPIE